MPELKESELMCGKCNGKSFRIIIDVEKSSNFSPAWFMKRLECCNCGKNIDEDHTLRWEP